VTNRRAIFLTARREVRDRLRSRAFLIATGLQVAVVLVIVAVSAITGGDDTQKYDLGVVGDQEALVQQARAQAQAFDVELTVKQVADRADAEKQVDEGNLDAAIDSGELITSASTEDTLVALVQSAARTATASEELRGHGLSTAETERVLNPPQLERVEVGGGDEGQGLAWIAALLLYIAIFSYGVAVATGVVEEKSTRVVEVILSAIRPVQLLAGKVLGIGLVGIVQVLLIVAVGLGAALPLDTIDLPSSTPTLAILVAIYFPLGYLLYACAFAATGSLVSRQEDVQSATSPLFILLVGGYILSFSGIGTPDSTVAVICTFVPFFAPMIAPARAAQDALPAWEAALSIALMLLAIAALIWLAARIYERAVLRMGAPIRWREALKLVRTPAS